MKLNACGEKVWCKVIPFFDMNYGYRIKNLDNGNHAVYTRYAATSFTKTNQLWILDTNGNIVSSFQIIPPNSHPNIWDPLVEDFIVTSDGGYLFTGDCYFPDDSIHPQWWYLQHLIAKFDSLGNEQWVRPQTLDTTNHIGTISRSVERNGKYYIVGDKSLLTTNSYLAYNGIIGSDGTLVFEKELHPDTLFNRLLGIDFMNDGTLIQAGKVSNTGSLPINAGVFKTDTLFNILAYLQCDSGTVAGECLAKTVDNKFLLTGYSPTNTSTWSEFDAFAMKVNENLEYDTLYSFPFVYDSLCPFPILTDTIDCDCDLITEYGEPVKAEERYRLQLYPNPAAEKVQVRLKDVIGGNAIGGG
ncbi:MAG: hypothetical protein ABIK52_03215, partial [Bacteroidota bacterium]